jgi:transketolase
MLNSELENIASQVRRDIVRMVAAVSSGHPGGSLGCADFLTFMYFEWMNFNAKDFQMDGKNEDLFFLSNGHISPVWYSVLSRAGFFPVNELATFRKLSSRLQGHPSTDKKLPGVRMASGSLGQGLSVGVGAAQVKKLNGDKSIVYTLHGDGELQEGQIWESLPGAARDNLRELTVIVDGNGIQSDTWLSNTSPLGDLKSRVEGCGWIYLECNGHDLDALKSVITRGQEKPTFVFAKTIKGAGINSMMSFGAKGKFYKFHSGSLDDTNYQNAVGELLARMRSASPPSEVFGEAQTLTVEDDEVPKSRPKSFVTEWSDLLRDAMAQIPNTVILDADLSYDTGTYFAREEFPNRYIQAGIAEQDMVSIAGTLALSGQIPIVHSFATFLSMRPTEQIFNNLSEKSRIIYCGFLAGLIPAAPGFSHQAVTDVGVFLSLPNIDVVEPSCATELQKALDYSISSKRSTYIRINSVGYPEIHECENFGPGVGAKRRIGNNIAVVTSGTTLLTQALEAADILSNDAIKISIYTYPFLGSKPTEEFLSLLARYSHVIVLENHLPTLGNFYIFKDSLQTSKVWRMGLENLPRNGRNDEVLAFHNLDAEGIAHFVRKISS